MKDLTLQQKIVIPILGTIALIALSATWYFVSRQNREIEKWFREELHTLAITTGLMIHPAAEEFVQSKGYHSHRASLSGNQEKNGLDEFEQQALQAFHRDPTLSVYIDEVTMKGVPHLAVFAPVKLRPECSSCHVNSGLNLYADKRDGDLVAIFGVSGSLEEIRTAEKNTIVAALLITILIVGILGWCIHYLLNSTLLVPMKELKFQSEAIADGDLRIKDTPALLKKIETNDEMGSVTRSYAKMVHGLRSTIHKVHEASLAVATASSQINSSMEEISTGAQEQLQQTSKVVRAIGEMNTTILENNSNASMTGETAQKAQKAAEAGSAIVSATVDGMKRIAAATKKNAERAEALGKSSKKIGEIVDIIDEIADQTNLLALNAAIEAARAGEHGRGFSVVADEVRILAERTMQATQEIARMITSIQKDTKDVVEFMSIEIREVNDGIALAENARQSLCEIMDFSQRVMEMVSRITERSNAQSETSEQISIDVETINTITNQMANGTLEVAKASEDLNRLTEQLQEVVKKFQLDKTESHNNWFLPISLRRNKYFAVTESRD
jgi:methyl-accepting chemotaxis protein